MIDQLPGLHQSTTEPGTESDAVETGLKEAQQVFAGHAAHLLGLAKGSAELFLQQAVGVSQLLLFYQLLAVVRNLAPGLVRAMLTGAVAAAVEQPIILGITVYVDAKPANEFAFRACKFGHNLLFSSELLKTVFISIKYDLFCQLISTLLSYRHKSV